MQRHARNTDTEGPGMAWAGRLRLLGGTGVGRTQGAVPGLGRARPHADLSAREGVQARDTGVPCRGQGTRIL